MLPNFLSHINETLRLVTLAAAYLNMSDQTTISNGLTQSKTGETFPETYYLFRKARKVVVRGGHFKEVNRR